MWERLPCGERCGTMWEALSGGRRVDSEIDADRGFPLDNFITITLPDPPEIDLATSRGFVIMWLKFGVQRVRNLSSGRIIRLPRTERARASSLRFFLSSPAQQKHNAFDVSHPCLINTLELIKGTTMKTSHLAELSHRLFRLCSRASVKRETHTQKHRGALHRSAATRAGLFGLIVGLVVLSSLISHPSAFAQVPGIINYQGLVTVNGANFTGTGQFKFVLVSGTGPTGFWSNDGTAGTNQPANRVPPPLSNGLYSGLFGDTTISNMVVIIPTTTFTNSDVRLRVWFSTNAVSGFQQLAPDQRIGAVGYALVAASVTTVVSSGSDIQAQRLNIAVNNILTGTLATIAGGSNNTASANFASVGGGTGNKATNQFANVDGGQNNIAGGLYATVGGGHNNFAGGNATVGGGNANLATGVSSSIGGGTANSATNTHSAVVGGNANTAGGSASFVGGGQGNKAIGDSAAVVAGQGNLASGAGAFVGGGGWDGFISGPNKAIGMVSTVAGGFQNTALGNVD